VYIINGHIEKKDQNLKIKGMKTDVEIEIEEIVVPAKGI
jgi:hypothetical protein